MGLKELYYSGPGYMPLVMTKDWQLAQLNYAPEQSADRVKTLDQHDFTDETFTLLKGRALLVTFDEKTSDYELTPLKCGRTYNVPIMVWHNIIMEDESSIIIAEGRDAHLKGCNHIQMPDEVREAMICYIEKHWN